MPRLFHVSEEAEIARFSPRPDRSGESKVWAVEDSHLVNYLLPRDCPRVTFHQRPESQQADCLKLLGDESHVVAIETAWLQRAQTTTLYVYEMAPGNFIEADEVAGYYTSSCSEESLDVCVYGSPIREIQRRGAQVRVMPCLWALREEVASSTLGFSIIRFRNASPAPRGFTSRFPVPGAGPVSGASP